MQRLSAEQESEPHQRDGGRERRNTQRGCVTSLTCTISAALPRLPVASELCIAGRRLLGHKQRGQEGAVFPPTETSEAHYNLRRRMRSKTTWKKIKKERERKEGNKNLLRKNVQNKLV